MDAEHAERLSACWDGDGDAADHAVFGQKRRGGELRFRPGITDDHRLAGIEREGDLRTIVAGQFCMADISMFPADTRL